MSTERVEALRKLAAVVGGLKAFEPGVREAIGNTNWTVLMQRLDEADAALSRTAQAPVADGVREALREAYDFLSGNYQNLSTGNWHDDDAGLVASKVLAVLDDMEMSSALASSDPTPATEAGVAVMPLEWRGTEGVWAKADALFGATYRITEYAGMAKPFKLETVGFVGPSGHYELIEEAKAAAQADFNKRILSTLCQSKPQALPDGYGDYWHSIDTAPEDQHVILATSGDHVGEALMLIDEDTGQQKWTWAGGPVSKFHAPLGWRPMPSPIRAPVLSDNRPGGFDGPTGAE